MIYSVVMAGHYLTRRSTLYTVVCSLFLLLSRSFVSLVVYIWLCITLFRIFSRCDAVESFEAFFLKKQPSQAERAHILYLVRLLPPELSLAFRAKRDASFPFFFFHLYILVVVVVHHLQHALLLYSLLYYFHGRLSSSPSPPDIHIALMLSQWCELV